jgi:hypothetical protein
MKFNKIKAYTTSTLCSACSKWFELNDAAYIWTFKKVHQQFCESCHTDLMKEVHNYQ